MDNTYIVHRKKISTLLNEVDSFLNRMGIFNDKYNNVYTYGVDIYSETDTKSKSKVYVAEIKIKRDGEKDIELPK